MSNLKTNAAWHYHNGTKHPGGDLLNPLHSFNPLRQPLPFKVYNSIDPVPLPLEKSSLHVPALVALSSDGARATVDATPDVGILSRVLYFSAGITKRIKYRWGEMLFRAAACTGALYHIELYVVCGDLPGLDAGVYHFGPQDLSLRRLREGDHRRFLVDAAGVEPSVASAPAIVVYTDIFWHNAVKYQAREYRHAFWDSGTILSHSLAMASAHGLPSRVVAGFVDAEVNRLLGLDTRREVAVALLPLGLTSDGLPTSAPDVGPLSLDTAPVSGRGLEFPAILDMHRASSLATEDEVAAWRNGALPTNQTTLSGRLFPLRPVDESQIPPDSLESVILRRGSTRRFSRDSMTFEELSTVLQRAMRGIPADFLASAAGSALSHPYLIVNAVDGLGPGAYLYHRDREALELLKEGNFRREAGHLGLDQALAADASFDIFFLADLHAVLASLGNRGYRAAQLDASVTAGRVYLAAYAQRLGASGLTFYDDEVTDFFSPHANGRSVMFLVAVGKRVKRP